MRRVWSTSKFISVRICLMASGNGQVGLPHTRYSSFWSPFCRIFVFFFGLRPLRLHGSSSDVSLWFTPTFTPRTTREGEEWVRSSLTVRKCVHPNERVINQQSTLLTMSRVSRMIPACFAASLNPGSSKLIWGPPAHPYSWVISVRKTKP